MSMGTTTIWSFYRHDTGLFTGDVLGGSLEVMLASTPAGCVPVIGRYRPDAHRFDAELGRIVVVAAEADVEPDPWPAAQREARAALSASDVTMSRITEALTMGDTTADAADVQAFVVWRRAVRLIAGAQGEALLSPPPELPARPPHPAGT